MRRPSNRSFLARPLFLFALLLTGLGICYYLGYFNVEDEMDSSPSKLNRQALEILPFLYVPTNEPSDSPPKQVRGPVRWDTLPVDVQQQFTMNGEASLLDFFFGDDVEVASYVPAWEESDLTTTIRGAVALRSAMTAGSTIGDDLIDAVRPGWYPCLVTNLMHFVEDFPVLNLDAVVLNPTYPWTEGILINEGIRKAETCDEKPIIDNSKHPKISVVQYVQLNKTYDLIFKFDDHHSAFMHNGLGRYGDAIDPDSDLKTMKAIINLLKDDRSLFVFSLPIGPDRIEFNAHRIYGPTRFKKLTQGLEIVKSYPCFASYPTLEEAFGARLTRKWENQWIFVVRKPYKLQFSVAGIDWKNVVIFGLSYSVLVLVITTYCSESKNHHRLQ